LLLPKLGIKHLRVGLFDQGVVENKMVPSTYVSLYCRHVAHNLW